LSDNRKNNGGHSTKSKKAIDKRKNPSRELLAQYIEEEFDYGKLKKVLNKLYTESIAGDTKSATLLLAYIIGKPKETKDLHISGEDLIFNQISFFDTEE